MSKQKLAIICGGKSAEHEISLLSAINILKACDRTKYDLIVIGITKDGSWYLYEEKTAFKNAGDAKKITFGTPLTQVTIVPDFPKGYFIKLNQPTTPIYVDIVFPILHGPNGEDGGVQGLLKCANIPFVGAGVLGSAVGMDKDVMKRLLKEAGIPITPFLVFHKADQSQLSFQSVIQKLSIPIFVKPANMGSSVGISKVTTSAEFDLAIADAFKYDSKVIIEEGVIAREIECAILGNENPKASLLGEVITGDHFYSYDAKYIDNDTAKLIIPIPMEPKLLKSIQDTALKAYKVLCCEGFARMDMFLTQDNQILINEINTIPGFTNISMYPKLWEHTGLSQTKLIDQLIELATI